MITPDRFIAVAILIWISIYTASYGKWTWKRKNKLGALMIFLIAIAVLVLPIYTIFFKE